MVHGHPGPRRRDRLAGHRLDRGPDDAPERRRRSTTTGSRTRSSSTRREVKQAADEMAKLLFTNGQRPRWPEGASPAATGRRSRNPMFATDTKPGCWMYKQGSFITGFFPKARQTNLDTDVGVFGFPPATAGGENPVEGGGDMVTLLNSTKQRADGDEADCRRPTSATTAAKSGDVHLAAQGLRRQPVPERRSSRASAEVAYKSLGSPVRRFRRDAGAVGAGSFWKEMVAWIGGQEDLDHGTEEHRPELAARG